MKHATSLALYAYWQSCRGDMGVQAGQIRAAELADLLPSLFLLDLDARRGLPFRFCGAAINARYGRDLLEESFLSLWTGEDRLALEREMEIGAMRSSGFVAGVLAETFGGGCSAFEMLVLPLAGKSRAAGAIGSMVRVGGHDEKNRFRARLISQELSSIRYISRQNDGPALLPPRKRPPERNAQLRRYGHLTLVPGSR